MNSYRVWPQRMYDLYGLKKGQDVVIFSYLLCQKAYLLQLFICGHMLKLHMVPYLSILLYNVPRA